MADALYLESSLVAAVEALGLDWVINLKDNQPRLLAEAKRRTARGEDLHQDNGNEQLWLWHEPAVEWPAAGRTAGVVETKRSRTLRRVTIVEQEGRRQAVKQTVEEESTDFYASNIEFDAIPSRFIHQIGRSRWSIETPLFQTLTSDCHFALPSRSILRLLSAERRWRGRIEKLALRSRVGHAERKRHVAAK